MIHAGYLNYHNVLICAITFSKGSPLSAFCQNYHKYVNTQLSLTGGESIWQTILKGNKQNSIEIWIEL